MKNDVEAAGGGPFLCLENLMLDVYSWDFRFKSITDWCFCLLFAYLPLLAMTMSVD